MFTACLNRTQKKRRALVSCVQRKRFARTGTLCPHNRFTLQVVGGFKRGSFTSGGWCCVVFLGSKTQAGVGCLREPVKPRV